MKESRSQSVKNSSKSLLEHTRIVSMEAETRRRLKFGEYIPGRTPFMPRSILTDRVSGYPRSSSRASSSSARRVKPDEVLTAAHHQDLRKVQKKITLHRLRQHHLCLDGTRWQWQQSAAQFRHTHRCQWLASARPSSSRTVG